MKIADKFKHFYDEPYDIFGCVIACEQQIKSGYKTVPFTQGVELHDELEKEGSDVTLLEIEDADHADIRFFQEEIWQEIITFFKTKL